MKRLPKNFIILFGSLFSYYIKNKRCSFTNTIWTWHASCHQIIFLPLPRYLTQV